MISLDRKEGECPPLLYNVGDKIMGFQMDIGGDMLVGGKIIEAEQSKLYGFDNKYNVELEQELCCGEKKYGAHITWWLDEKNAQPFDADAWKKAFGHWTQHKELKRKSYLEYIRMHMALRKEKDDISDKDLEKKIEERHKI